MDSAAERGRLLERDAQWAAAAAEAHDVERIVEFWTNDALVYAPGFPVVAGKAALRAYVQASLAIPGFRITWTSSDVRLSPDGQLAYMLSENVVTAPDPTGQLTTSRGRAVTKSGTENGTASGAARSISGTPVQVNYAAHNDHAKRSNPRSGCARRRTCR
jgi:ketosteroid isomerase-like protein